MTEGIARAVVIVTMGGRVKQRWLSEIEALRIPNYEEPKSAVTAMKALRFYAQSRVRQCANPLWGEAEGVRRGTIRALMISFRANRVSESSMLMINSSIPDPALQAHLV